MANSQIDRLSNLHDALLLTILSLLPTRIAARTSVLCRRFRHLWEASPSLELISQDLPHPKSDNFLAMAKHALLSRNPSHPLLSLRVDISGCDRNASFLSSLLAKARSLDLHHLTVDGLWLSDLLAILPIIFTINSLMYLTVRAHPHYLQELNFPSGINLICLRSLSLKLIGIDLTNLNPLLSELRSLEDLHLYISETPGLSLSSWTIRKLKLIIATPLFRNLKLHNAVLSLPSLESLHLDTLYNFQNLSYIHGEVPVLRKAVINLRNLDKRDVSAVAGLLNWISNVEELSLHLKENKMEYPIPILWESGKDVLKFSNLKHLDVTVCFHEHNFEAVTTMLHNCPVLESLKLVHEIPEFTGWGRGRKRKDWGSRLLRNADRNYRYVYFKHLHLKENRKEVIKLLSEKCSSKRQARN